MIKIMDRSIWYYIKRPQLAVELLFSSSAVRLYSLFIMDLIENDLVEYSVLSHSRYKYWLFKGSDKPINLDLTVLYIDDLLDKKSKMIEAEEKLADVKNNIKEQLEKFK